MYRNLSNRELRQIIEENDFKSKALVEAQRVFNRVPPRSMEEDVQHWLDGMYAHLYDLRADILDENKMLLELLSERESDSKDVA